MFKQLYHLDGLEAYEDYLFYILTNACHCPAILVIRSGYLPIAYVDPFGFFPGKWALTSCFYPHPTACQPRP